MSWRLRGFRSIPSQQSWVTISTPSTLSAMSRLRGKKPTDAPRTCRECEEARCVHEIRPAGPRRARRSARKICRRRRAKPRRYQRATRIPPLSSLGTPMELVKAFGDRQALRAGGARNADRNLSRERLTCRLKLATSVYVPRTSLGLDDKCVISPFATDPVRRAPTSLSKGRFARWRPLRADRHLEDFSDLGVLDNPNRRLQRGWVACRTR